MPQLGIPNQTVKRLMYGYLRDAYRDVGAFSIDLYDFSRLTHEMAFRGARRPVMEFLGEAISRQTGIRDYIDGEKVVQGFLAAYLNVTDYFMFHSEHELGGGYAGIYLEPFLVRYPGLRFGYVIEIKYLPRRESAPDSRAAAVVRCDRATSAVSGRRTLDARVLLRAVRRSGHRVPRLETGALRRRGRVAVCSPVVVRAHRMRRPMRCRHSLRAAGRMGPGDGGWQRRSATGAPTACAW